MERFRSFGFAFQGIAVFFKTQHNAWIHLLSALIAIAGGFYFRITGNEWCWIIAAISMVFITEMLNTAIEFLCDHITPVIHPQIKKVKDISAAAVFFAAIAALAIGLIVFLPKIW
jgi:diacylglycerol kinase